jgi:hypothetical protein
MSRRKVFAIWVWLNLQFKGDNTVSVMTRQLKPRL